jgi:hypothetical protein
LAAAEELLQARTRMREILSGPSTREIPSEVNTVHPMVKA